MHIAAVLLVFAVVLVPNLLAIAASALNGDETMNRENIQEQPEYIR